MSSSKKRRERAAAARLAARKNISPPQDSTPHTKILQSSPEQPLAETKKFRPTAWRKALSRGQAGLTSLVRIARATLSWIWCDKSLIVSWLFRLFTLSSVGYLVYDRIYETGVNISVSASDPRDPLYFPFSIVNNSHIFTIRHINYLCGIDIFETSIKSGFYGGGSGGFKLSPEYPELSPGGIINISCRGSIVVQAPVTVTKAVIDIVVDYETSLFGIYSLKRRQVTRFTWAADASNPQWIKGDIVPTLLSGATQLPHVPSRQ